MNRETLIGSIAYQHRLLEQYSALTWSWNHSTRNRLTRHDYERLAQAACRREWELQQELERMDNGHPTV